ncbi:unnamed protein product [Clonostachys rhizophaga]|uniref:non-specific serine/threonine protein kinase n=1 Tax=Clonostachys rhizophaga TaxID=160324 RepID=A0A9N9VSX6_9HYPO|nr:unnamed protein product [Clonostachys rhizophaga]
MSAAIQTATHQSPALGSPPLSTSSNRHYTPSQSSPAIEANNAYQRATSSPSSRRPPSRKASGNGSPAVDTNAVASRNGGPYSSGTYSPQSDRSSKMPPVAPPRTSSNQQSSSSRRNQYPTEKMTNSPKHVQSDRSRPSSRSDPNGAFENGHRSKRAPDQHYAHDPAARPSGTTTTIPIRTQQPSASHQRDEEASPAPVVGTSPGNEERRGGRSRHDYSNRSQRGTAKFGDFILGNTIGEGEFGKVKLGWKQDSSVQVAIKLIKRDTVGGNPSRLAKIHREVTILRDLQHPNIVQLIDMVETDRYIGIILEYASGGELFDFILNHRYLKDQSARRLFAQLVSGVGYLHKKGIVHRDLKLENLLLDRNRNIIITDFGFANTFDPVEELTNEEELNLSDRDYVKRMGLDKVKPSGMRKGDLMQTSCGSPCYAAPELVVSDCLYTGRKVDVWSCGVILYAMLAGYLPFDDDPANPEGDNINLLYKYIVTTPLTFPEYVTPHARDLLRRILVPNPRKRADLFEVARHSWLSEYAHVVEFITSSTTLPQDIQNVTPAATEEAVETPVVTRSSSVREQHKQKAYSPTPVGGLAKAHAKIDTEAEAAQRTPKDAKRRTVQVEYVAPTTQTQRGAEANSQSERTRSVSRGRAEDQQAIQQERPIAPDPPVTQDTVSRPPPTKRVYPPQKPQTAPRGPRDPRDLPRETRPPTDNTYIPQSSSGMRPQTGHSLASAASMGLQSVGQYGQPAPPAVADTNAEGRIEQPSPIGTPEVQPPTGNPPPKFAQISGMNETQGRPTRGHKRSSTLGEIGSKLLGRSGSVFGRSKKRPEQQADNSRKYPPISMANAMPGGDPGPRPSMESKTSRRSFSLGLGKKRSGSINGEKEKASGRRRFSLLPPFSMKSTPGREDTATPPSELGSQHNLPIQDNRMEPPRSFTSHGDGSPVFETVYGRGPPPTSNAGGARHQRFASAQLDPRSPNAIPPYMQQGRVQYNTGSESSIDMRRPPTEPQMGSYQGFSGSEATIGQRGQRGQLHKNAKKFTDAYDQGDFRGPEASTGAAKRVMDFFRKRGKARGGEER